MPRLARSVFADVPHHVTQRGNRREDVFFTNDDYLAYLDWLLIYSQKYDLEILAYCLMTNHIHMVVIPSHKDGLHMAMKPLHMRYAQRINKRCGWKGHVWQGRYYSSALDERYMWAAIRYVELNPVRAHMVPKAEYYPWSSAATHCGLRSDEIVTSSQAWQRNKNQISNWSTWLSEGDRQTELSTIRKCVNQGLPCGSDRFISELGKQVGRSLHFKPQGRPKKKAGKG